MGLASAPLAEEKTTPETVWEEASTREAAETIQGEESWRGEGELL